MSCGTCPRSELEAQIEKLESDLYIAHQYNRNLLAELAVLKHNQALDKKESK